jgi:putative membrane protein
MAERALPYRLAIALMVLALLWSATGPSDRFTWLLETVPVMVGIVLLAATRARFPLTPLLYTLIALHAVVLCVGGRYTYAEVPIGFVVQDALDLSRNHYDRLGHFFQGLQPAILARELLLRRSPLPRGKWLFFIVTSICLAFSAFYELLEWWTAAATGASADAFLGTQGDVWDPQWDMFMALCGALSAQLLLARLHDRQLSQLMGAPHEA